MLLTIFTVVIKLFQILVVHHTPAVTMIFRPYKKRTVRETYLLNLFKFLIEVFEDGVMPRFNRCS